MKTALFAAAAMLALSACSKTDNTATDSTVDPIPRAERPTLIGQWEVESIDTGNDYVIRPAEIDSTVTTRIEFDTDSTLAVATNCNTLGGRYTVNGDSLAISDVYSTRMSCPNMDVEEILTVMLPEVKTYSIGYDGAATLYTSFNGRIINLRRVE